ncbi:MAG TPA: hypothetical protein VK752_02880 [Bryobacteraceae bacterium]|jgi:hypothetical protein|nr:hypothetical protein [Bryobacteraceae bacterium]
MFFRRDKVQQSTFESRLANLKQYGFQSVVQSTGVARVQRDGYAAIVESLGDGKVKIGRAGVLIGDEIGELVNLGYQMIVRTPSGVELPALASHLKKLHDFDEDLREGLGLTSLYNLSLGTTTDEHLYDRVVGRDKGEAFRWEK